MLHYTQQIPAIIENMNSVACPVVELGHFVIYIPLSDKTGKVTTGSKHLSYLPFA